MDAGCKDECRVRWAERADVAAIFELIESMTGDGTLLRRPLMELHREVETFVVAERASGEFLGCAGLYRYSRRLVEVRSVAVKPCARGCGVGGRMVERLLVDAGECACLFTRVPKFFRRFGFRVVPAGSVRAKVAKDCQRCARRMSCDEIAMVRGELPARVFAPVAGGALVHLG